MVLNNMLGPRVFFGILCMSDHAKENKGVRETLSNASLIPKEFPCRYFGNPGKV